MAYSFSLDVSLKLRGCDIRGFLNHFLRESDDTKQHSNENIHTDLTHNNMTLVYDAATNRMKPAISKKQIMEAINNRLSDAIELDSDTYKNNGKKVRKDAVKVRGLIMQIDPQFYEQNKDNPKAMNKSYSDMLHLAQKQYGKQNIVAVSVHLDETNPHLHMLLVPVTDDNRLSQKDFIDKKKLQVAHKEMREELRSKGYDIDLERRTPQNAKRLSERDYKALKDSAKRIKELDNIENNLKQCKKQLDDKEIQLDSLKGEFERFRTSESQRLEVETQHNRELEQQATTKLQEAEKLYEKSKEIHSKLMNMSDVFTEKFADDFARELGFSKKKIKGLSK